MGDCVQRLIGAMRVWASLDSARQKEDHPPSICDGTIAMIEKIDRIFGEKYLTCMDNFYDYGVHLLFNEWWENAPKDAVAKYVAAIENHPEQGQLAHKGWYAEPFSLAMLEGYAPGTLGAEWLAFMVQNNLVERLALGYRELHEEFAASGKLDNMPAVLQYKVLRGYQTHDLHHVLTGYGATPFEELALQSFGLAQQDFPYAAMTLATIMGHATLVDPLLIKPAMDAIVDGWDYGRTAKSIQFVAFETMLDRPLSDIREEYGLGRKPLKISAMADVPELLREAA
jgi:ubiquinone biosynthesis protein COQ4